MDDRTQSPEPQFLPRARLQELVDALKRAGFRCVGPTVRDGAIVFDSLDAVDTLPFGIHDEQQPGSYRLHADDNARAFAWANGPQALKPLLFAAREVLWRARRQADGSLRFDSEQAAPQPLAVIGVRACDLAALAIHDQHFVRQAHGASPDPAYARRRAALFLVAVNCSDPAATCFCASTGDGPRASSGFDILLDELDDGYLLSCGSEAGRRIAAGLVLVPARREQSEAAMQQSARAERKMTRRLPGRNLRDTLFGRLEHPRWNEVAERCLSCGNCTSVCPTCFCHAEREQQQIDGSESAHLREWDSCFTRGHSQLHGYVVRPDTRTRYRQWLTHKLGSWHDQFGRSGCVGCGRCIAWCPVGIDITEEAGAICSEQR